MKYKVRHSYLQSPEKIFKRDEIVTPEDLIKAGFSVDHLLANDAIEPLEGTEAAGIPPKSKLKKQEEEAADDKK